MVAGPPPGPAEVLLHGTVALPLVALRALARVGWPRSSAVPVGETPEPPPGRAAARARNRIIELAPAGRVRQSAGRAPAPGGVGFSSGQLTAKLARYRLRLVRGQLITR